MTPPTRLPREISLWDPPTQPIVYTSRFGPAKYAWKLAPHPPLPNDKFTSRTAATLDSDADSAQAIRKETMLVQSIYADVQEFEKELEWERNAQSSRDVEELAIPIQPRKHIGAHPVSRPIDPVIQLISYV